MSSWAAQMHFLLSSTAQSLALGSLEISVRVGCPRRGDRCLAAPQGTQPSVPRGVTLIEGCGDT